MEFQTYGDFPSLSSKVCGIEKSIESLRDHVKKQDKQITLCLQNERDTAAALLNLQKDYNDLLKYASSLEEYCLDLDVNLRKKHLILTGIDETPAESNFGRTRAVDDDGNEMETEDSNFNPTLSLVFDMLHAIHDTLLIEDLDVAYRLGRKGPNPRPILVKFAKESTRNEVNRKRFNLKDLDESKNVFLNEDLPAKVNAYRADLRCLVSHAKSKNVSAKLFGNRVSIDNKMYGHKDIDKLPEGLKMSDAKIVETAKGLAFQSQHAFLSNFFPCKVFYNNIHYKSAEHAYQHTRAVFFGFHSTAETILRVNNAEKAKKSGSNLPNSKDWDACKQKIMKDIVSAKFAQNQDLNTKLLATGDLPLLEATYDSYWGCGLPLSARKLKQGEWHGKNYLGIILAECRLESRRDLAMRNHQINSQANVAASPIPQSQLQNAYSAPKHQTQRRSQASKQSSSQGTNRSTHGRGNSYSSQSTSLYQTGNVQSNQPQQSQPWPPNMMFQPPGFSYPTPMPNYFMYPPLPPAQYQMPQSHPGASGAQVPPIGLSPPGNSGPLFMRQTSPPVSDYSNHGDRRLSYDPELSPVIHV